MSTAGTVDVVGATDVVTGGAAIVVTTGGNVDDAPMAGAVLVLTAFVDGRKPTPHDANVTISTAPTTVIGTDGAAIVGLLHVVRMDSSVAANRSTRVHPGTRIMVTCQCSRSTTAS
jgi:hypothetical protein